MPKFSQESFSKLSTCHSELQALFYEVVRNIDCLILEGHRGQEAQDMAFAANMSKLKWPNGNHNQSPSMAVDVSPYPIDWKDSKRFYYFSGYVLGIAQKLKDEGKMTHAVRWGGNWDSDNDLNDNKFNDLVHFELI